MVFLKTTKEIRTEKNRWYCLLITFEFLTLIFLLYTKYLGMERRNVILTAIFGTVGGLAILVVFGMAAWLYLRAKKSKQDNDLEPQNEHGDSFNDGKSPKRNGLLTLKTPLISTKSFGLIKHVAIASDANIIPKEQDKIIKYIPVVIELRALGILFHVLLFILFHVNVITIISTNFTLDQIQ
ncbi:hypothetical protein E2986_12795 [Frieseomelitta varia]|uniref:Uncharacterized protein n=1 Tax=Frieseomelitta varia TaxID=561572 RepID=A0A833S6W6_9HYME|nr:hypothetical protein E2986_12795 [Frieseomelitta varia]